VLPLAGAQGAGAEMRQSLGTAVFAGMLGTRGGQMAAGPESGHA
jgi:hypothetical protein